MSAHTNILRPPSLLLTLEQTAERLSISKRTLEREISKGKFPRPLKIGRASRVPAQDLDGYLQRLHTERTPPEKSK